MLAAMSRSSCGGLRMLLKNSAPWRSRTWYCTRRSTNSVTGLQSRSTFIETSPLTDTDGGARRPPDKV
jgi:hypothetical protein